MDSSLCRRMHYLRSVEGVFALVIPCALIGYWLHAGTPIDWRLRLLPLMLVSFILIQGAFFWHLKYLQYKTGASLPLWFARAYRSFKRSNFLALGVAAVLLLLGASRGTSRADLAWAGGLFAFATLEHINYYHYQLMYDTASACHRLGRTRRLRTAVLAVDLRR